MSAKHSLLLLLLLLGAVSCHTGYMSNIEVVPAETSVAASGLTPAEVERARALFTNFARDEGFRLEEHRQELQGEIVRSLYATQGNAPSLHVDLVEDAFKIKIVCRQAFSDRGFVLLRESSFSRLRLGRVA